MKDPTFTPAFIGLYPHLCQVARERGYALAVHGTVARDFDLVAIPWTDAAVPAEELMEAIAAAARCRMGSVDGDGKPLRVPEPKPHGRLAWAMPLWAGAYIDLSVLPRLPKEA